VYKFGLVRPILNKWHPSSKKITYWFPTLFSLGFIIAVFLLAFQVKLFIILYGLYFVLAFLIALYSTKNVLVSLLSLVAISIQFFGYGYGFLKSTLAVEVFKRNPETHFPNLFFKSS
jgi:hypothetical protein